MFYESMCNRTPLRDFLFDDCETISRKTSIVLSVVLEEKFTDVKGVKKIETTEFKFQFDLLDKTVYLQAMSGKTLRGTCRVTQWGDVS